MKTTIAAIVSVLTLATASPTYSGKKSGKWYALDQLARFDNDNNGLPLVAASPINLYLDLFWNGMSLVEEMGSPSPLLLVANSPPNAAAFSTLDVATVAQGQPSMTVNYSDSTIDHFDLKSFFFGCVLATQVSILGKPISCTVTVKGYKDVGKKELAGSQTFSFDAGLLQTQAQMVKADVKYGYGFEGVKHVDFFVSQPATTAAVIDTVSYVVYSSTNKFE